jgi:bifunctional non-homologous end joining protein LigD
MSGTSSAADKVAVVVDGRSLTLTNLAKVLYPDEGFTKAEVLDYYQRISPVLLPHVAGRPMTLKRYPEGVDGQSFFQKHAPAGTPDWVATVDVASRSSRPVASQQNDGTVTHVIMDDLPTLMWAANLASLELHVPMWRVAQRRVSAGSGREVVPGHGEARPDLLVFDLDPGPPATIVECCRVAEALRPVLASAGLEPLAKTSGGKGLQLYAKVSGITAEQASDQAKSFAQELERARPDLVTSRMTKSLRPGKVLIDWSQNNGSKTTIAPYSLRARQRPTVSTPVSWDEVEACASQQDLLFTAHEVPGRVAAAGDLFAALLLRRHCCYGDTVVTATLRLQPHLAPALGHQQERVGGDRGVIHDAAVAGHLLELRPLHPAMPQVLLLDLQVRVARRQAGGQEVMAVLRRHAVRGAQAAERGQVARAKPRLLRELQRGQLLRCPRRLGRESALREGPAAPPDRVPVLLHEVEAAVLGRDDQGEVRLVDERVAAPRPVPALDLVLAQPDPGIGVDDPAGQRANIRDPGPGGHRVGCHRVAGLQCAVRRH